MKSKVLAGLALVGVLGITGTALAEVKVNAKFDDLPKYAANTQSRKQPPKFDGKKPPMSMDKMPPKPDGKRPPMSGDKRPPRPPMSGDRRPDGKRPPKPQSK